MSLTLRFTEWSCGHHCQRPDDIPVDNPRQASLILAAISHAINQPGHARAVLMSETHAVTAHVTDDYVAAAGGNPILQEPWEGQGELRSTVIYGTEAEIALIGSQAYRDAVDLVYGDLTPWDGKSFLDGSVALSALSLAELEAISTPLEYFETDKVNLFEIPPVFLPASEALTELLAYANSSEDLEPPYELPHVLESRAVLPGGGAAKLTLDLDIGHNGYAATVASSGNPFWVWVDDRLQVFRQYQGNSAHYYCGQTTRQLDGLHFQSDKFFMVPDSFGNLTEVPPWN